MNQKDRRKSYGGGNNNSYNNNNNSNNSSPKSNNNKQHHHHHGQQHHHHHNDGIRMMKDRTTYISMSLVGYHVSVLLKNGESYEGILHSAFTENNNNANTNSPSKNQQTNNTTTTTAGLGIVLKMARKKETPAPKVITTPPIPSLIIEAGSFVQLTATGVVLDHYKDSFMSRESFITDTELSGFDGNLKERELTRWTPDESFNESLDDFNEKSKVAWDQFATNEKLFGVRTTYEEELYTTRLDRESDFYRSNEILAEKKAAEIEGEKSTNIHLLEERGYIEGADYDEEERYSSVVRKSGSNTSTSSNAGSPSVYVPPSKRQQSTPPTATTAAPATKKDLKTPQLPLSSVTSATTPSTPNSSTSTTNTNTPPTPTTPSTPKSKDIEAPLTPSSGAKESPNISILRFNRDNSIDQDVLGSPREGLSPRSVAYTRYRHQYQLKSSGSNIATTPSSQTMEVPKSPAPAIVSNHELVKALSLELATPVVPQNLVADFNSFKLKMNNSNINRVSQTEGLKNFSRDFDKRSNSRPGSPLIGPNSPRPTPSSLSLSGTTPTDPSILTPKSSASSTITNLATVEKISTDSTVTVAAATTTSTTAAKVEKTEVEKEKEKEKETTKDSKDTVNTTTAPTTTATTTMSSIKPLSKLKLNPNAKEFVPPTHKFKASSEYISNTDSVTPINQIYFESMKKRQNNPESPDTVSSYWFEYSYEDPYGSPYPPQMRPVQMGMPMNAVPYYAAPPPQVQMGHPQQIKSPQGGPPPSLPPQMQAKGGVIYQQPPPPGVPRNYIPGPVPPGAGMPPNAGPYVFTQPPPPFQHYGVPQPIYNGQMPGGPVPAGVSGPPPPHVTKRFYPNAPQYHPQGGPPQIIMAAPTSPQGGPPQGIPSPNNSVHQPRMIQNFQPYIPQQMGPRGYPSPHSNDSSPPFHQPPPNYQ
ncbi:hypothetical protein CYY_006175 [Polysphondylium violaceum]|uniref:LsmAD domain-containing protein n=1 Tax=Polysphondylium violaceum TaxID=133409 RepID=A0A8J4UZ54_9MYCE|nr:hypothetical protein CYY_006175 [Polysphondylium violaceum]